MARRKRPKSPKEGSDVLNEAAATKQETEEPVDTGGEDPPATGFATDELAIAMTPAAEDDEEDREELDPLSTEARVLTVLVRALPKALEPHLARLDRRSRDRMHAALAEATARDTGIEDAIEELQTIVSDIVERLDSFNERLERAEEACGLRPSLLTATEAAVARLDEMAQGGRLRAAEIRAIHRTLRAAVQEERARRQG